MKQATSQDPSQAESSCRFFDGIEGLTALSPINSIDGLYVGITPSLGLQRVPQTPQSAGFKTAAMS